MGTDSKNLDEVELERDRLRAMLAGLLDAVIVIDPGGIVTHVSDSVQTALGYEPEELIGQNIKILMPEPHRSAHDGYLEKYRDTGETWILNTTRQFPVARKDGSWITCELSVSRIDVGDETFFSGAFRDVTARVEAEERLAESEHRFRAIFDQEYQFVGLLDPDGRVLEANRASLDLVGMKREEVLGKLFWETPWWSHSEKERARMRQAVQAARGGEFVRFETENVSRYGLPVAVDFSLKPIIDSSGAVIMLLPEGRDITALKEAQQRETSMLRALAAIGESASVLAHEIKNPITAVNIALRAVADRIGQDHSEILEDLVKRMQKLESTMRRTLSFARPMSLRREETEPAELAREAVATLQPLADRRDVKLEFRCEGELPAISVDPGLCEEVLLNLVRNAIEASPENGSVRITLKARDLDGDGAKSGVRFTVEDDGPGVPPSMLPTLFQPFHTSKEEGTGLGLALARRIVEEHGGTLGYSEAEGGGASFCIELS